jgi:cobalamin biosynthesis Mg chelatase CobN
VASTGKIMEQTDNPLIRQVMEIILRDSQMHRAVQQLIVDSLERENINLDVDQIADVWDAISQHIQLERQMLGHVEEALAALRGKHMLVQEYLLSYLLEDERKHDSLLAALEKVKQGAYPYAM